MVDPKVFTHQPLPQKFPNDNQVASLPQENLEKDNLEIHQQNRIPKELVSQICRQSNKVTKDVLHNLINKILLVWLQIFLPSIIIAHNPHKKGLFHNHFHPQEIVVALT